MRDELIAGEDARGYASPHHKAVCFRTFATLFGSALFAIVLLVGSVKLQQLSVVFSEVVGVASQLLCDRPSQIVARSLNTFDLAQLGFF